MDRGYKVDRKAHPKEKANFLSLILFAYVFKVYRKGVKKDLTADDMYHVMSSYKSRMLGDKVENEYLKDRENNKKSSILRLIFRTFWAKILLYLIIGVVTKIFFVTTLPIALSKFVSYFVAGQTEVTKADAYFYAIAIVCLNLIQTGVIHHFFLLRVELALNVRAAICALIYRKCLRLKLSEYSKISIGKLVTIMVKDTSVIDRAILFALEGIGEILQIFFILYLFYTRLGTAPLFAYAIFTLGIPVQLLIGYVIYKLRKGSNKKTDERLQLTKEILAAIRVVKMYTWEKFYGGKVLEARRIELKKMNSIFLLKAFSFCFGSFSNKLSFFVLIVTYVWLGNPLTAEIVYYITSCYQKLRRAIHFIIPLCAQTLSELCACLQRMDMILHAEEMEPPIRQTSHSIIPKVDFSNAKVKIHSETILRKVNLKVRPGLNILIGPVGSGKTSILNTILEEFPLNDGKMHVEGTVSFAAQNSFLFPSSLKQNILFGQTYNESRYEQVLKICALRLDVDSFINGDETIVSDNGVNLSKGQQARVNLARAIYKDSDIYLLDDCLAALDNHVTKYVFKECIKNFLKDKLVIFVTHNRHLINEADNVICMMEGTVEFSGKPSDIPQSILASLNEDNKETEDKIKELKLLEETKSEEGDHDDCSETSELMEQNYTSEKANIYHEKNKEGKIGLKIYKTYIRFGGGMLMFLLIIVLNFACEGSSGYGEKLISQWVNVEEKISNFTLNQTVNNSEFDNLLVDRKSYYNYYTISIGAGVVLIMVKSLVFFMFSINASRNLHRVMVQNIFGGAMRFFDTHMIGNILNRFSKDLYDVDEHIPFSVEEAIQMLALIVGTVILVATVNIFFAVVSLILCLVLFFVTSFAVPTGRSLRRLNSAARSPIVGHVNASLEGLVTIRAYGTQHILRNEYDNLQDYQTSVQHLMEICSRALAFSLHLFSEMYVASIILKFLFIENGDLSGNVGLAVSQAFQMSFFLEWGVRQWVYLESFMTSMERVMEYTNIEQESKTGKTLKNWPSEGKIKFDNVNLTYRNEETVLKNLNFTIAPNEKIGVVGRTGAGKSSIIVTLFRLYDVDGTIAIDDVDIKTLSLEFLRTHVAIIPQDPVLFTGTMRSNLDPLDLYTEEEIWKALSAVGLKPVIDNIDEDIQVVGQNFSIGQKQLVSLARAILRKSKIIILDEATANMDKDMDTFIQSKIDEVFQNCTTITVAHRLQTVMRCNRIMVLDKGEIVEFDTPNTLMDNKDSRFYKMVLNA